MLHRAAYLLRILTICTVKKVLGVIITVLHTTFVFSTVAVLNFLMVRLDIGKRRSSLPVWYINGTTETMVPIEMWASHDAWKIDEVRTE